MEKRRFESFEVFSCLKKVNPRILSTFKRSFSKKMGKNPRPHIIHSLGREYCWIVRDSEPIRLVKSPRSLSVYILKYIIYHRSNPLIFLHEAAFHFQYGTSSLIVRFNCSTAFFLWINWSFRNTIHPFLKTCSLPFLQASNAPDVCLLSVCHRAWHMPW